MIGPVTYVCNSCGSDDVSRDAWSDWDIKAQQWVLRVAFDYAHCHRCDCEASLKEVKLSPPETVFLPA